MALPTIVSRSTNSDAAGTYTAYTYSDGHVSTDPANRPISKEDLQRQIRNDLAQKKARQSLSNDRARFTKNQAQQLAPNAQQIAREEFDVINGGLVTKAFNDQIRNLTKFASTATAVPGQRDQLVANVPLGGELTTSGTEFVSAAAVEANQEKSYDGAASIRYPLELRRSKS